MKTSHLTLSRSLIYLLILQGIVCITIVFDIPFARQFLGFIFFLFVPGFLILRLVRTKDTNITITLLLSVGLSIVFLMLIGLLLNEFGSFVFKLKPLSAGLIAIVVNISIALLALFSFLREKTTEKIDLNRLKLKIVFPYIFLPLIGLIGNLLILTVNNYSLSILTVILIPIIFVYNLFYSKSRSYYPLIIFSIALTLLLSTSLVSHYIYGSDIQREFNTFLQVKNGLYWDSQNYTYYQQASDNSMLSVGILPTLLSNLLNIDPVWIFKIVFPLIYSLLPLGLYLLYEKRWGEKIAFISAFFFMANFTFFTVVLTNAKQMIAEPLFIMLFLVLFSTKNELVKNKWLLFVPLVCGLIVSHYSMFFMFSFLIVFAWFGAKMLKHTTVSASFFVLSSCLAAVWYAFVTQVPYGGPLEKFAGAIGSTFQGFLTEFFSFSARGEDVQAALGILSRPSALHYVGTLLYDLTVVLILIGFVLLLLKTRKGRVDFGLFPIELLSVILLIAAVFVPRFSGLLELGRLYQILLFFLSPLFVLGVEAFVSTIMKIKTKNKSLEIRNGKKSFYVLILSSVVLISFFLFQSGLLYEISGDPVPSSINLSKYKMEQYSTDLIHENDVLCAAWLSEYGNIDNMWTFADSVSFDHVLTSYSLIDPSNIILLHNTTQKLIPGGVIIRQDNTFDPTSNITYIYLSEFNMRQGIIRWDVRAGSNFNLSDIQILNSTQSLVNKIYTNSASEIDYRVP